MYVCVCLCMYIRSTFSGQLCWLTDWLTDCRIRKLMDCSSDWLIVCLLSATERSVSNVARRISIRTYKVKTVNKTLPSFVSRNSWHPLVEPWGSTEPDLRTAVIVCSPQYRALFYRCAEHNSCLTECPGGCRLYVLCGTWQWHNSET